MARPNVLMFGDQSWISDRTDHQTTRLWDWLREVDYDGKKLAIIECGAGTAVPTVRLTCENLVQRYGATLIRINPREPNVPPGEISIPLPAGEALDRLALRK